MWLYIPRGFCPSAPASGDSTSDSEWRAQMLASSLTLKGKRSPPKSWLRAWKAGTWTRRLFGRTSRPLMAARGVAAWIASLEDSLASHSAKPENCAASPTNDGCGTTSRESSTTPEPTLSSSRMSPDCVSKDFDASSEIWPHAGSMRNGTCSRRNKSARPTFARGSLSWPTATTRDAGSGSALRSVTKAGGGDASGHPAQPTCGTVAHDAALEGSVGQADADGGQRVQSFDTLQARRDAVGNRRDPLGDPDSPGLEGCCESVGQGADELPAWPPGPASDAWGNVIARWPDLAPAIEPVVRGMANGLSPRVDRLRALGNGCCPPQVVLAFTTLAGRFT